MFAIQLTAPRSTSVSLEISAISEVDLGAANLKANATGDIMDHRKTTAIAAHHDLTQGKGGP